MYKTWAVPLLYTASRNSKRVLKAFKAAEGFKGKAQAFKSREAKELLKLTVGAVGAYLFWQTVFGNDDAKDQSPIAKLKRRVAQELTSSLSALDPNTWLSVRPYELAKSLANDIHMLALLEKYDTTTSTHKAGDLKAINDLRQKFTPAIVRQFMPADSSGGDKPVGASTGTTKGASSNALKRLQKLKGPSTKTNPALNRLKSLKKINVGL
jgi:hypothetical protein